MNCIHTETVYVCMYVLHTYVRTKTCNSSYENLQL